MTDQKPEIPIRVVVMGDVVVDHHLYEGERRRPAATEAAGVRFSSSTGGAAGLARLLLKMQELIGQTPGAAPIKVKHATDGPTPQAHAYAIWRPFPIENSKIGNGKKDLVWRARLLGYGDPEHAPPWIVSAESKPSLPDSTSADVLVIDDADLGFRSRAKLDLCVDGEAAPIWIILKTTSPISRGGLWHRLVADHADRLICLVSADDLRDERCAISRGVSWERTALDLRRAFQTDPALAALLQCRHLVVALSADGALWIDRPAGGQIRATLIFDPGGIEGEWSSRRDGKVTGYLSILASSLALYAAHVTRAVDPKVIDLAAYVEAGLAAMRNLSELGHGRIETKRETLQQQSGEKPVKDDGPQGFPVNRIANLLTRKTDTPPFARAVLPWPMASRPKGVAAENIWTFLEASELPRDSEAEPSVLGLAQRLVVRGPRELLANYPHASFGSLLTFDRREIEALRNIRARMRTYAEGTNSSKPLSIGVFGPPGAGKSFGVKQLAHEIFGARAWLEFNLSQLEKPSDLMGPFHQARDLVLAGVTPVVFWDEFDSRSLDWLQYLIGPMQDGHFQGGELTHSVGKSVYVFAGGTSWTFDQFRTQEAPPGAGNGNETSDRRKSLFGLRKGPDFVSRLDAHLDVAGPDPRRPNEGGRDNLYPIRRAQLIRHHLCGNTDAAVEIDPDLLNALLLVTRFRHGSRSLEKFVKGLMESSSGPILRSALPPRHQLEMYFEADEFGWLLDRNVPFRMGESVDRQAAVIHDAYRAQARNQEREIIARLDCSFDALSSEQKEDNRAAARRIVDVLSLVGMGVSTPGHGLPVSKQEFELHVSHHLERLAEAEHDGWMAQRSASGWTYGEARDFERRTHPCLIPYKHLGDVRKNDRMNVQNYRCLVEDAGFEIVWLQPTTPTSLI